MTFTRYLSHCPWVFPGVSLAFDWRWTLTVGFFSVLVWLLGWAVFKSMEGFKR